jgi:DNA polymerase-3 subunit beta
MIDADVLRDLISRTAFAISKEESRYTLNGALLLLKPQGITMVTTDGHRMQSEQQVSLATYAY